jgi:hypothetical protein
MESEAVRNIVISVQNKVQELDTAIGETVIPALIARTRSPEADSKKKAKSDSKGTPGQKKRNMDAKDAFVLKPTQFRFETKPEVNVEPSWPVRPEVHTRMEKLRKQQSSYCREIVRIDVNPFNAQLPKLIARPTPNYSQPVSGLAQGVSRGPLDTLTDYELKEVLRRLPSVDRFRLLRVNKRWRSMLQQTIQGDKALAMVASTLNQTFRAMSSLALELHSNVGLPNTLTSPTTSANLLPGLGRRSPGSDTTHSVWLAAHQPIPVRSARLDVALASWVRVYLRNLQLLALATPIDLNTFKAVIEQRMLNVLWLGGSHFTSQYLNALPDYTTNLQCLWLHQCSVDDEGLRIVVRECFRLNHLRVSECPTIRGTFCSTVPRTLQQFELYNCRQLGTDTWSQFMQGDRKGLTAITVEHCYLDNVLLLGIARSEKMQRVRLRFSNTPNVTVDSSGKGTDSSPEADFKVNSLRNLPRLETLVLRDYCTPGVLSNSSFCDIQRGCDRLLQIEIEIPDGPINRTGGFQLTDAAFEQLAENCPKLQSLTLINCVQLTAATLASLTNLKLLKQLVLNNVSFDDQSLQQHFPSYRSLSRLKLIRCAAITETSIRFLFTQIEQRNVWFFLTLGANPSIRLDFAQNLVRPRTLILKQLN